MAGYSRKQIARNLRKQGHTDAALSVLLDYTEKPDDNDGDAATAVDSSPTLLSHAELAAASVEQIRDLRLNHREVYDRSLAALAETKAKA